jgi:hypothetical protein
MLNDQRVAMILCCRGRIECRVHGNLRIVATSKSTLFTVSAFLPQADRLYQNSR